jgi:hypothetical protein
MFRLTFPCERSVNVPPRPAGRLWEAGMRVSIVDLPWENPPKCANCYIPGVSVVTYPKNGPVMCWCPIRNVIELPEQGEDNVR